MTSMSIVVRVCRSQFKDDAKYLSCSWTSSTTKT